MGTAATSEWMNERVNDYTYRIFFDESNKCGPFDFDGLPGAII